MNRIHMFLIPEEITRATDEAMGKRNYWKYEDAKILYKKSNTICSQSRTFSGVSQFFRSGVNVSQSYDYYIKSGKIKRDLSIETDVCILRRYYKSKRNKLCTRHGSNKSKYSSVISEIDTIKEIRHGACGDSKTMTKDTQQIDIAAIMVDNLKGLLTNWIQRHLLENKETQERIEMALHSILHKGKDTKVGSVPSQSTYVLTRDGHTCEVKNKNVGTASFRCDYCKDESYSITTKSSSNTKKISSQSVPSPVKKLIVPSTLSIPRNINIAKIKHLYKAKIMKSINKLSIHNPKKNRDSSSFDLLAISTRSFTKRCTNYGTKRLNTRRIPFHLKSPYKKVSNTTKTEKNYERCILHKEVKKAELEDKPSLVKSIYADHLANVSRPDDINRIKIKDTFTLTENNNSNHMYMNTSEVVNDNYTCKASLINKLIGKDQNEPMTTDLLSLSIEIPNEVEVKENMKSHNYTINVNSRKNVYLTKKRRSKKLAKHRNIQNTTFTLSHKQDDKRSISTDDLREHIQSILEFITKDRRKENFKLDIHLSLMPVIGKSADASSHISNIAFDNNFVDRPTSIYNVKPSINTASGEIQSTKNLRFNEKVPEIIALLDGAASQAKYILNIDNSKKYELTKNQTQDKSTITSKLEIVQEIHDLKTVIKDLLHTAKTLVSEQLKKETHERKDGPRNIKDIDVNTVETLKPLNKPISQGIQISNDFAKNLLFAGIKLSKEPRKDTIEFCHRLMRKSTSYKIIESESVLRVTDMTVGGKTENIPQAADCTMRKSKSLIDVRKEKKKVMAYFCDGGCNNSSSCKQDNSVSFYKISSDILMKTSKKQNNRSPSLCECSKNHTHQSILNESQKSIPECPTSIYIDVEECCDKKSLMPLRKGMGFGEGFIYCILLWIPVTIIVGLFYNYVIKDLIHPSEHKVIGRSENKSMMFLKLSDLGF